MSRPYEGARIDNAANPHHQWGYFHGPIPNNNPDYMPNSQRETVGGKKGRTPVKVAELQDETDIPDNPRVKLSKLNTYVCDVVVDGDDMCGKTFGQQPALRRHIRQKHPGAIDPVDDRSNLDDSESIPGNNALKLWIRSGGWRRAGYVHEPGRGSHKMNKMCDTIEAYAAANPEFAAQYGTKFHRDPVPVMSTPSKRRKSAATYNSDNDKSNKSKSPSPPDGSASKRPRVSSKVPDTDKSKVAAARKSSRVTKPIKKGKTTA
ncbi:hypothetical protein P152DRAFT_517833 [Eremomyces bilateralis CBS 781.70]|uniref:C2H2-type domain-containing protein n=1 Tax=Eremomyces bilateralis CBS 781.70 TaxID=1392243 RepID=A0A6G1FQU0_9PEZI|nr:uncharacterized protein P152DRAFT_517833 [Eremomyces bilateralis CBS 781.70]KAF1808049.1 hypothetical protein P152DRAFT_517833 [Eremomyces bilateralis CBS 781.70]